MKEQKPGKITFWKTRSFRIILTVVILLSIVMLILLFMSRRIIEERVEDNYALSGRIVAEIAAISAENYGDDFRGFADSEGADLLMKLCHDYEIEEIYIEVKSPVQTHVQDVVEITEDSITKHELTGQNSDMPVPMSEEEKKIFQGDIDQTFDHFVQDKKVYITYLHGLYDDAGKCYAICGVDFLNSDVIQDVNSSAIKYLLIIGGIFLALILILLFFLYRQVLLPVKRISDRMRGFVNGEEISSEKLVVKGSDEFAQMARDFNTMNDEIHEYIRTMETVNAAANIQAGMLLAPRFETEELKINAFMRPAKNVGGDFYDFIKMPDGKICLVIADVSGKGISAALFMAQAITAIRHNTRQYENPADLLRVLNTDITPYNPEQMFVTVFVAIYDPASGTLTYTNAGHNPPYLIRDRLIPLDHEPDLIIGLFDDEEYHNVTIQIQPGDMLFLFTDGVNEAVSGTGQFLGAPGLEEILMDVKEKSSDPELFTEMVVKKVDSFAEGAEQHDDITMMTVLFKGMKKSDSLTVAADLKETGKVREFILHEPLIPESHRKKVYLVVEEIFVNICNYAYNNRDSGTVQIDIFADSEKLELKFTDSGIPYDPTADVQFEMEYDPDTMMGGLGKILAFKIMDQVEYKYEDNQNILMLRKKQEKGEI